MEETMTVEMGPDMEAMGQAAGGVGIVGLVIYVAIALLMIISLWKLFSKAGQPGWASIIPIYQTVVMLQVAGKPIWWIILLFVPIANVVIAIMMLAGIAKNFGKGVGFVLGMIFLPIIFLPILGLGSAEYAPVEA
jgi:hypothetical protein